MTAEVGGPGAAVGGPVLDPAPLRRMAEELGDGGPALVAEMVTVFLADAPGVLSALREAVQAGDAAAARRAAHTLKGNAASVGAVRLAAVCRRAEELALAQDVAAVAELLPALEAEQGDASAALRRVGSDA